MQNNYNSQQQSMTYNQNFLGGQQKKMAPSVANSKNIKTMMNQMKNRKIKASQNQMATGSQGNSNGRAASLGATGQQQHHMNGGNIVQGNLNIVKGGMSQFASNPHGLGNTQTFNSMSQIQSQPNQQKGLSSSMMVPARQGSGRKSSKNNTVNALGYQSMQAQMNTGDIHANHQAQGQNSRAKSVHQFNGQQLNQQQRNRQYIQNGSNQPQSSLMNDPMLAQNNPSNFINPQKSGKRSNSDNYQSRKHQNQQPIGSKVGDSGSNNQKQKMNSLTNKLNSIYSSNQNVGNYLTQQQQATSSLNGNIGQLVGNIQNLTQHQRGSAVSGGSQIPIYNSSKVPQYSQNLQRFGGEGNDETQKYNTGQGQNFQSVYNQKQGPSGGKVIQINSTKANGLNQKILNKTQNLQNYGIQNLSQNQTQHGSEARANAAKNGQNRSHSTQMKADQNNKDGQSHKEKTFNKSHGRLPTQEQINQNMILTKGNIHGAQNSQQMLQNNQQQMASLGTPGMSRKGISPKRSAGQIMANQNGPGGQKRGSDGQRAKSSGQKQGSTNYNSGPQIYQSNNVQNQSFGMQASDLFYNHASSAAPASGAPNANSKHTRNQAASDVLQAAQQIPQHMNTKIPMRPGGKKSGPGGSMISQNNLVNLNTNTNQNPNKQHPQGGSRNQINLNNNYGMNNQIAAQYNHVNNKPLNLTQQHPANLHKRNTIPVENEIKKDIIDPDMKVKRDRVPSGGKRIPSAKRNPSVKSDSARRKETQQDNETNKQIQPQLKQGQLMVNQNIRKSRNEKVLPQENKQHDQMNPTSAGQSTSSLHKQEQFQKKMINNEKKENQKNDSIQNVAPVNQPQQNQRSASLNNNNLPSAQDRPQEPPKKATPQRKSAKGRAISEPPQSEKPSEPPAMNNQGLSGRNLYFQQIRNEITMSESSKYKCLPDYQNAKFSNKRNGLVSGYGANTNQGIVRNYNEDRVAIILNIMKPKSKNFDSNLWPKCSFFGIYDGHGGAVCADFLRDYLHQFIIKDDHFPQNPIQALRNGFREAERLFMEFAESQEKEAGEIDRSGSCAVVILIIDDMCYCANTGDSRAIMSADGGEKLFLLSTDHKPTDEVEMKRIIENGGRIYQNSQIIQTNPALGEAGKQVVYGPHRVFPGRLSVSRTVGDIEAKLEKYEGNPNVVIADPDVTAFEIKDNHDFIVIGCDGVFDKLSSKDAIHIGWQKVLMEANKSGVKNVTLDEVHNNCGHCVDGILRTSALRRTVDNVTCVVVSFDGFQKQLQKFIDNNLDGTTVDVIEEIQLEPIPEYLSNQRIDNKKRKADSSMLLLDENEDKDVPNPKDQKRPKQADILLSEIAEEDDVSSVSESIKNPYGFNLGQQRLSQSKVDSTFGPGGKSSVTSVKSVQSTSKLSHSHNNPQQSFSNGADKIEQKRRSEMVVPISTINSSKHNPVDNAKASISSNSILSHEVGIDDPYGAQNRMSQRQQNMHSNHHDQTQAFRDKNLQSLDSQISDLQNSQGQNANGGDQGFKGVIPGNNQSIISRPNRPGSRKRPSQTRNSLGSQVENHESSNDPQVELSDIKAGPISRGQKLQSTLYGNPQQQL